MTKDPRLNQEAFQPPLAPLAPTTPDFSDVVQGEDLEFRRRADHYTIPITHKIETLGYISPPNILSRCSTSQLITLAGAASGFFAGVVVCPLDVIKTKIQARGGAEGSRTGRVKGEKGFKAMGFLETLKSTLRHEGVRGLYRGLVPITIGYLPTWTIYFTVYEKAKNFYPNFLSSHWGFHSSSLNHFCAAVTAGMASSIAVNPIWVVKTRLMVQTNKPSTSPNDVQYKGTIDAFRKMYREEGIRVFYSGLIPSLFGLLHVGIHFPVYERLKTLLHCNTIDQQHETPHLLWRLIAASSISKMFASTITYPHEILRTRLQIRHNAEKDGNGDGTKLLRSSSSSSSGGSSTTSSRRRTSNPKSLSKLLSTVKNTPTSQCSNKPSLLKVISNIYHREGLRGFYAGYFTNLLRTVPASAVTLVSFEYFKTYLLDISGKSGKLTN